MNDPFTDESTGEPLASASFTLPAVPGPTPSASSATPAEAAGEGGAGEATRPTQPLYVSPVLTELPDELLPDPTPACETCPAAMWFLSTEELKCFCSRMHVMTWAPGGEPAPIMRCDGRELALIQLAEDMADK